MAGVFTEGSITQLRSHGFGVLYFPFDAIVEAFKGVGIDAFFDEDSADHDVQSKVDAYSKLSLSKRRTIIRALRKKFRREIKDFIRNLEVSLTRSIESIFVLTLHGRSLELTSLEEAIQFIEGYEESKAVSEFIRYEVQLRYTNGDEIRGQFESKTEAISFLDGLR